MNCQEILLKKIRQSISSETSINEAVSNALQISYDAAHRRISMKSKFSIEETVALCKEYGISMDHLFQQNDSLIVEKTKSIKTQADFKAYFEKSKEFLSDFHPAETTLYYSAKDIPMNYAVTGTLFSKFKFFIWFNLLTNMKASSFEDFVFDTSVLNETSSLKQFFEHSKCVEIWNDTTINSSLQQIYYFFESGLLLFSNAKLLLEDITKIIADLEQKCQTNTPDFQLYHHELLILNNSVLFTSNQKLKFFLPYNALGYYVTSDKNACLEQKEYIANQLSNSKSLNQSGKKDQKIFFNKMRQKVDFYKSKLENL
jgi:hypothetical protein